MKFRLVESNIDDKITIYTYQSKDVINMLNSGKTYYAIPTKGMFSSAGRDNPYIQIRKLFGLSHSPIFGAFNTRDLDKMIKSSEINTKDKELLTLSVPRDEIKVVEYYDWVDYIYALYDRKSFEIDSGITLEELENILKEQKDIKSYDEPQAIIDRIEPGWVIKER